MPPVECCLGTRPIQAARLRPDENAFQSPTSATRAVATIGPTPGISSRRRLSSQERCQAWMRFSIAPISAVMATYWRARTSRLNRAAAGMRSSSPLARILSSSAVPLRPLAEMMPSLSHVPTDRVRQHGSLTNQELPAAMQHQARLLLFRFGGYKPHRRPRHRLADGGSVVGIVLATLKISLHVTRRHKPHSVAKRLKLTAPMMCTRARLNTDQAGWQSLQRTPTSLRGSHRLRITTTPSASTP